MSQENGGFERDGLLSRERYLVQGPVGHSSRDLDANPEMWMDDSMLCVFFS